MRHLLQCRVTRGSLTESGGELVHKAEEAQKAVSQINGHYDETHGSPSPATRLRSWLYDFTAVI